MTIPATLHFCWIGPALPWAYVFAILSAAERSGLPDIILHHTDALQDGPELRALAATPGVRLLRLDAASCLARVEDALGCGGLAVLYANLGSAVQRSDILRAAILWERGGIYLDLDTITVASLVPLLGVGSFVGSEFIVWPLGVRRSRSPLVRARHLALDVARKVLRLAPRGWLAFRRIERLYFRGVNNAVMGAAAGSPLLADYLRAMPLLLSTRRLDAYALGPDLLQAVVDRGRLDDLVIHDPQVFYPLAPEISEHWFRIVPSVRLQAMLCAQTRVVHWYASIRTRPLIAQVGPGYVLRNREHQPFSRLVADNVPALQRLAGDAG